MICKPSQGRNKRESLLSGRTTQLEYVNSDNYELDSIDQV